MTSLRSFDGTRIAWWAEEGLGGGPPALLSHGSSFNSGTWAPVRRELRTETSRILALDHRNHGGSQGDVVPVSWWDCARDVALVASVETSAMVGIGHSMGGAALMMACVSQPDLFSALVLVEPIVAPPPFRRDTGHPIIDMAGRRRAIFDSSVAAREYFLRAFPAWDEEALEGYLRSGLTRSGEQWVLACPSAMEIDTYRAGFSAGVLDHLERIAIPVSILVGAEEDTYPLSWAEEIAKLSNSAHVEVVAGAGHFLPMTHPGAVVQAYRRVAASVRSR